MQITFKSEFTKRAFVLLEVAAFLILSLWIFRIYLATRLGEKPGSGDLLRGV
jgi:uncharacterized membrane protein HdeD (DUF308 family)